MRTRARQRWLQEQPDLTVAELAELAERLQAEGGPTMSAPTLCRALQRLGLRRKKRRSTLRSATQSRRAGRATNTGKTVLATPVRG